MSVAARARRLLRCFSMRSRSRRLPVFPFPRQLGSRSVVTAGAPRMFSSSHFPRTTGEVLLHRRDQQVLPCPRSHVSRQRVTGGSAAYNWGCRSGAPGARDEAVVAVRRLTTSVAAKLIRDEQPGFALDASAGVVEPRRRYVGPRPGRFR